MADGRTEAVTAQSVLQSSCMNVKAANIESVIGHERVSGQTRSFAQVAPSIRMNNVHNGAIGVPVRDTSARG